MSARSLFRRSSAGGARADDQRDRRLLDFTAWVSALGRTASQPRSFGGVQGAEIPLREITGSVARAHELDHRFRPSAGARSARYRRVEEGMAGGRSVPAVQLIQLGGLFFVEDGHRRLAAAHALGALAVDAHVRKICTVAFACAATVAAHLEGKVAERRFLDQVALPDPELRSLWLDDPGDYPRLAEIAQRWTGQVDGREAVRSAAASTWWHEEVMPSADQMEGGPGESIASRYLRYLTMAEHAARRGPRRRAGQQQG